MYIEFQRGRKCAAFLLIDGTQHFRAFSLELNWNLGNFESSFSSPQPSSNPFHLHRNNIIVTASCGFFGKNFIYQNVNDFCRHTKCDVDQCWLLRVDTFWALEWIIFFWKNENVLISFGTCKSHHFHIFLFFSLTHRWKVNSQIDGWLFNPEECRIDVKRELEFIGQSRAW